MIELSTDQIIQVHGGHNDCQSGEFYSMGYYIKTRAAVGALIGGLFGLNLNLYHTFVGALVGSTLGMGYGLVEWWVLH